VPDDTNGRTDVLVRDRRTDTTSRISVASDGTQANAICGVPAISADGRYVAPISSATNRLSTAFRPAHLARHCGVIRNG
jgi:hypothetical protein